MSADREVELSKGIIASVRHLDDATAFAVLLSALVAFSVGKRLSKESLLSLADQQFTRFKALADGVTT